jgi:parallel beta-helix repeat protein
VGILLVALGMAWVLTATFAGASTTFSPIADSYVDASSPASNYGTRTTLKTDGSPVVTAYLKFNVQGVGPTSSAQLRVFAETGSSRGFGVYAVSDPNWGETTINAGNAPTVGALLDSVGAFAAGTWQTFDVSGVVTADGVYSFALKTSSSTAIRLSSRQGTNPPQLLVPAPAASNTFTVSPAGSSYTAVSDTGTVYNGSVKSVVEAAVTDLDAGAGGTVSFTAGTFNQGTEFFKFYDIHDIVFAGAGIDVTTIVNSTSAAADTEPFNFSGTDRVTVRDMTVSAGGPARSTSDALDFDNGNDSVVERVKVTASRGRAIIFDGKNTGYNAVGNRVTDCVITGVSGDGIELLAASSNRIEGCTITNTGLHGIQVTKASTSADQANKKSSDNVITGNTIDNAGQDGINVNSGDRNQITSNTITNSSNITSGRDGIRISSADSITCNDNVVSGNTATDNQAVKTQKYGLNIGSALCNRTVVGPGNNFAGNLTAAIRNLGTGTIFQ